MAYSSLAQGLHDLESEMQDAFNRIQNHLNELRQAHAPDMSSEKAIVGKESAQHNMRPSQDLLEDWLLKDDVTGSMLGILYTFWGLGFPIFL